MTRNWFCLFLLSDSAWQAFVVSSFFPSEKPDAWHLFSMQCQRRYIESMPRTYVWAVDASGAPRLSDKATHTFLNWLATVDEVSALFCYQPLTELQPFLPFLGARWPSWWSSAFFPRAEPVLCICTYSANSIWVPDHFTIGCRFMKIRCSEGGHVWCQGHSLRHRVVSCGRHLMTKLLLVTKYHILVRRRSFSTAQRMGLSAFGCISGFLQYWWVLQRRSLMNAGSLVARTQSMQT